MVYGDTTLPGIYSPVLPDSAPPVSVAPFCCDCVRDTDGDAARSPLELSRLWKKFWSTSCWLCPEVGLGELANGDALMGRAEEDWTDADNAVDDREGKSWKVR